MSEYVEDEDDYMTEIYCIRERLQGGGSLDREDVDMLLNYVGRLESLVSELANKTGFADDYCGGWQGYIETEYE